MKSTIEMPVAALKTALPGLAKVISTKSHLPALGCVRIVRHQDGTVMLHGTDLDSFVRHHIDTAIPGPSAEFLIPLAPLREIVRPAQDGQTIDLTLDDDDRVTVGYMVAGTRLSRRFEVPFLDDWPKEPDIEPTVAVDDTFKRALREALDCCGEDESRPALRGAFLDASKEAGHLVSSDGRHLYCANSFTLDLPQSVILPGQRFLVWPEFVRDGQWGLGMRAGREGQPAWVVVSGARWRLITRTIDGQFPNWRNVPPAGQPTATVHLSDAGVRELADLVPRLPVSNPNVQAVGLAVRARTLRLQHRASERDAWTEIAIPNSDVSGTDCDVWLNRTYLLKALRWGLSKIDIRDTRTPLVFRSGGRQLVVGVAMEPEPHSEETHSNPPSQPETSAGSPSEPAAKPPTESETTPMANTATKPNTTITPPATPTAESSSPLRALIEHLEKIRGALRDLQGHVNDTAGLLKAAERQQRTTEQEVESVRRTLRGLQKVQL